MTVVAMLLCVLAAAVAKPGPANAMTTMEKRLVARINDARAARGLRRLRVGAGIQRAAHRWAGYLIRADSFYHGQMAPGTSENIAWGTCRMLRPARMVRLWLNSSGHRANLLDRSARYIGAGASAGRWRGYRCIRMGVTRFH